MESSKASAYALHALMYMVRHVTQLPAAAETIAKTEGIPAEDLNAILKQLTHAGFVQPVQGHENGYVFAKPPQEITLLELFETLEDQLLLDDCPLRHGECGVAPENCCILAQEGTATNRIRDLFERTNIVTAAWNHLEYRFGAPSRIIDTRRLRIETTISKSQIPHKESNTPS
jgi:Rrf2 family protein